MSVSVVMPNFNNANTLVRALAPLLDDKAVSEIVIYDNASTDDSVSIINALASPKIRLICGGENCGATLARHEAIRASTGDSICFLDGDDFLSAGAVTQAYQTLREEQLDICLFQMFDVDEDGANPTPSIRGPKSPIGGRQACELTLGSWQIHIWGVIRKAIYEKAWRGFKPHGYSDDEVLTRRILLAANRVGSCSGRMFYRVTSKAPTPERTKGIMRTTLAVLGLSNDAGLSESAVRHQRNVTTRFMLGMARRRVSGEVSREEWGEYFSNYNRIRIPWRAGDWRFWLMDRLIRALPR